MAVVGNAKNARIILNGDPVKAMIRGNAYELYYSPAYSWDNAVRLKKVSSGTVLAVIATTGGISRITLEAVDSRFRMWSGNQSWENTAAAQKAEIIDSSGMVAGGWDVLQGTLISFTNLDAPAGFTVSYNANGGTGSIAPETGFEFVLASSGFTKEGYTLTGWNTEADGSGLNYTLGQTASFEADTTLYAVWSALPKLHIGTHEVKKLYLGDKEVNLKAGE